MIIPTRNREKYLTKLLDSLEAQVIAPDLVIVVDSSDFMIPSRVLQRDFRIKYIHTPIRSAAKQRNEGMDFVSANLMGNYLISFLDDDVEVPRHYLQWKISFFTRHPEVVGVSGVTRMQPKFREGNFVTRLLGFRGEPGSITKAIINLAPPSNGEPVQVSWLIGCSSWNANLINNLRFEKDFTGNSIFEDVIFSYRAGKSGKLVCAPELKIDHRLSDLGRDSIKDHYYSWIVNRYRLFDYSDKEFSKSLFVINTVLLLGYFALMSIIQTKGSFFKFKGLFFGSFKLLRGR